MYSFRQCDLFVKIQKYSIYSHKEREYNYHKNEMTLKELPSGVPRGF